MKAYLSVAIHDPEEVIIDHLEKCFKKHGFTTISTNKIYERDYFTTSGSAQFLRTSGLAGVNLFIGLIFKEGKIMDLVLEDWSKIQDDNRSFLMLIDKNIQLPADFQSTNSSNLIFFDSYHLEKTIHLLKKNAQLQSLGGQTKTEQIAWYLGGEALAEGLGFIQKMKLYEPIGV